MKRAKVTNAKLASVRKFIFDPNDDKSIIGTLNKDDVIEIDPDIRYFDWTDKAFYKCKTHFGEGYIRCEIVELLTR